MDTNYQPGRLTIQFRLRLKAKNVLDEVAFVFWVKSKFNGKMRAQKDWEQFETSPGKLATKLVADFYVEFPDMEQFGYAKQHCYQHTDQGEIKASSVGALDRVDPGRWQAKRLKNDLGKAPPKCI
jgi:hypothetical protein